MTQPLSAMTVSRERKWFGDACTACGACREVCPFLETRGGPDEILRERPEEAFFCTNCGACRTACPVGLDPAAALWEAKRDRIEAGALPEAVGTALRGARAYVRTGQRFPFRHYPASGGAVFWPGCGLAGTSPVWVRAIRDRLEARLGEPVGIVLDCCGDPVWQMGDEAATQAACGRIRTELERRRITRVVTGCHNCRKVFAAYLTDIPIDFAGDLLAGDLDPAVLPEAVFLHHPCPSRAAKAEQRTIEAWLGERLKGPRASALVACCGNGGSLPALDPALADRFTRRITDAAGERAVLTACTGCGRRFQGEGRPAYHLLACLPGCSPLLPDIPPARRWANRLGLALALRLNPRTVLLGLLVVALVGLGLALRQRGFFSAEALLSLLAAHPVAAPFLFVLIYAVAPSLFLPSIPLTLAAGFLWGPVWGVVFAITGATAGAAVAFFLARTLLGDAVRRRFRPAQWEGLETQVKRHGWKAVAFTRLIPVFPFNVLNYLFGLTPIPFAHYLWSTFVFMLPACIAFVAFGSTLGELLLRGNLRGVGIGLAVAVLALIVAFFLKPYFRRIGAGPAGEPHDER